ncbi:MAG: hypothetical protein QXR60_05305 [Candidatus Nanoarchaeia archaeon]
MTRNKPKVFAIFTRSKPYITVTEPRKGTNIPSKTSIRISIISRFLPISNGIESLKELFSHFSPIKSIRKTDDGLTTKIIYITLLDSERTWCHGKILPLLQLISDSSSPFYPQS